MRVRPVLSISLLASTLVLPPARAAGPRDLIVTRAGDAAELRTLALALERQGAVIHHFFPPDAMLGEVPAALEVETIPALAGKAWVLRDPDDLRVVPAAEPVLARMRGIWREVRRTDRIGGLGAPLAGDALVPDQEVSAAAGPPAGIAADCGMPAFTSAYLLGDVAVGIILPESVSIDPAENSEDWDTAREDAVVAEIVAGADQIALAYPEAGIDFFYEVHRAVPTEVEPILHPSGFSGAWVNEAMRYLGHSTVHAYIQDLRRRLGTDWTVAAFVADSRNDADGKFPDGRFAFAYIGGPYLVMTYDNDGWGIGGTDSVFAHELGHSFNALDEYAAAGIPCTARSGMLQVESQNSAVGGCRDSFACLMRANAWPTAYCSWSEGQLGLRDLDGDGVADLRDTPPRSFLTPLDPDPSSSPDVTLAGWASAVPDPTEVPYPIGHTLNSIAGVDYRLDGGAWLAAAPLDGQFDTACEDYTIALTGLAEGWHEVESRALAQVCDSSDPDVCDPPRTIPEATFPSESFYINADCAEDGFEPNDVAGQEPAIAAGTTPGLRLCAFDPDRFGVYLRAGATLDARAEYDNPAARVTLDLIAPSGTRLASGAGAGGVAAVALAAATETGNHVLAVRAEGEDESTYRLVVTASCIDDRLEPSDDPAAGPALAGGATPDLQLCPANEDWYGVSLSDGADLTVNLTHTAALGDLELGLYRPDATPIVTSETALDLESVSGTDLPAGVYRVRVWGNTPLVANRYQLDLASDLCLDDLGENDDDAPSARLAPEHFAGRVCGNDTDWSRIDVARPSFLAASLVFNPTAGELALDLLDRDLVVVARGAGTAGLRRVTITPLPAGTYYLRVAAAAAAPGAIDYTLDVHLADPLTLKAVKRDQVDVLLDWNDVGVPCHWIRRSDRKETYDGGFETVTDIAGGGADSGDPTSWIDAGVVPDGVLYFYDVSPTACGNALLAATKTADPYPVVEDVSATQGVTFTLTVRNEGREGVSSISLVDEMPPGGFRVLEIPPGATDNSVPTGGRFGGGTVRIDGMVLAPGDSTRVRVFLGVQGTTGTNTATIRNQARVTGLSASGQLVETLSDDPSTHAVLDSTDVMVVRGLAAVTVTAFWNQDVGIDLRVVDPCGNPIGPADLPFAECPPGGPRGSVGMRGGCGDTWPWGWIENVTWWTPVFPTTGTYHVFLRYTDSRDSSAACRHGGLEDVVVVVERPLSSRFRWVVLDPAETDWVEALSFDVP